MKDYRKELERFIDNTKKQQCISDKEKRWSINGALAFCYVNGFIDTNTYNELQSR